MVVNKETAALRYYELRESIDDHGDAVMALASETGHDAATIEQLLAEEVGA